VGPDKRKPSVGKELAVHIRVNSDDMHPLFLQLSHLICHAHGFGLRHREAHRYDIVLRGDLPQLVDLTSRTSVIDHQIAFDAQRLSSLLHPHANRIPKRRIAICKDYVARLGTGWRLPHGGYVVSALRTGSRSIRSAGGPSLVATAICD